uniref:WAP, Kazal, immunoglobulin, Kunitz and NTR domain-containing protein n=1 Tax=Phallusia mammillata TaxID=59560 RepID=A0A6F9DY00_9ASCI|nr:WAP, Kazal, immunoglobulin, Kunitz and NTR domain-containing protein [Phallusia mammillata]
MQYLNLSDPEQAIRDFALTTNRSCPCPNLHSLMHRPTTNGETTTASCGGHSRRSNSACPNVIITGQRVNGSPTITDESLGVAAQPKNIIRLQKAETTTGVCQFLDLLVETDA